MLSPALPPALTAAIPYKTFPIIEIGPLELRTFGLMVGIGVLLGAWIAGAYGERWGVERDDTYRLATRMVLFGVLGARLTWDVSHWDQIDSPLDLIAVWEGGLQFSGGFIAAVLVGIPAFRKWSRVTRWHVLDGYAMGLTIGLGIGRIGCYSVGEHFGSATSFFLATRYEGGDVREPTLGMGSGALDLATELARGNEVTFHHTALYELLYLLALFAVLWVVLHRKPAVAAGTGIGLFCLFYAISRGLSDFLRVNDETVLGLTGAQWMCVALLPISAWILTKVRRRNDELEAAEPAEVAAEPADGGPAEQPATEPEG